MVETHGIGYLLIRAGNQDEERVFASEKYGIIYSDPCQLYSC